MLNDTPLDSITVKELVHVCGVSRQSFYYYFDDIRDAVESIFSEAADLVIREHSRSESWQDGCCRILNWILAHRNLVLNVLRSIGTEYAARYMDQVLYQYLIQAVRKEADGMAVTEDQCDFITRFYCNGFVSVTISWINHQMEKEPDALVADIDHVTMGVLNQTLTRFEQQNIQKRREAEQNRCKSASDDV